MAARSKLIVVKLQYTPTKKKEPQNKKNIKLSWGALRNLVEEIVLSGGRYSKPYQLCT